MYSSIFMATASPNSLGPVAAVGAGAVAVKAVRVGRVAMVAARRTPCISCRTARTHCSRAAASRQEPKVSAGKVASAELAGPRGPVAVEGVAAAAGKVDAARRATKDATVGAVRAG